MLTVLTALMVNEAETATSGEAETVGSGKGSDFIKYPVIAVFISATMLLGEWWATSPRRRRTQILQNDAETQTESAETRSLKIAGTTYDGRTEKGAAHDESHAVLNRAQLGRIRYERNKARYQRNLDRLKHDHAKISLRRNMPWFKFAFPPLMFSSVGELQKLGKTGLAGS